MRFFLNKLASLSIKVPFKPQTSGMAMAGNKLQRLRLAD